MLSYMVGKLAPNPTHFTRGLDPYVPGRGYFRAVPSQNGDKFVTSPPPQLLNGSFSENAEVKESVRDEKGSSTPEKWSISYSSNIQPRRVSPFAALYTLSRETLQSLQTGLL